MKITKQDFRKSKCNNNKYNNTDFNDINPILSNQDKKENDIEKRKQCEKLIKENIDYDILVQGNPDVDIGGMIEIMLRDSISKDGGIAPSILCVICGLSNAAYQRPDGVYVVPIMTLKD